MGDISHAEATVDLLYGSLMTHALRAGDNVAPLLLTGMGHAS